jgi:hypothetical protein
MVSAVRLALAAQRRATAASREGAGRRLRVATAEGLRTAVLVVAGGIAAIALVALMLRPQPLAPAAAVPCPRALVSAARARRGRGHGRDRPAVSAAAVMLGFEVEMVGITF